MIKGKFLIYNLFLILFFLSVGKVNGQILESDTTLTKEVPVQTEKIHSPKKAAIFSAVLPGLGQAYNKKYWKIPIVYAGFGAIGYFIGWNNNNYQTLKLAYKDFTDGDDTTNSFLDLDGSKYYDLDSPSGQTDFKTALNKQQEYYRRNRDLLIISFIGFYGLNIIDASVDAHLFDFNISEDLTFDWQPALQNMDKQLVYGFNCRFNF